jgi:hypothetical protein
VDVGDSVGSVGVGAGSGPPGVGSSLEVGPELADVVGVIVGVGSRLGAGCWPIDRMSNVESPALDVDSRLAWDGVGDAHASTMDMASDAIAGQVLPHEPAGDGLTVTSSSGVVLATIRERLGHLSPATTP